MLIKGDIMVKYCGYEIGRGRGKITPEEVRNLFDFLHANYTHRELVMMRQKQLCKIAKANKKEWKIRKVI